MRYSIPIAAAVCVALLTPALAQPTDDQIDTAIAHIDAAELSDADHLHMWCGAAFGLVAQQLVADEDSETAEMVGQMQEAVFAASAESLRAAGMSDDEFGALAGHFAVLAISQMDEEGAADYTQDECIAAAEAAAG